MQRGVPYFQENDIPGDVNQAASVILAENVPGVLQFHVYRSILVSPTFHVEVMNEVNKQANNVVVVDPLVLSMLASKALK